MTVRLALSRCQVVLSLAVVPSLLPAQTPAQLIDSADRMIASGRAQEASDLLQRVIREATDHHDTLTQVHALNKLARASYDLGDPTSSLHYSHRVMELGAPAKAFAAMGSALVLQAIVADQLSPPDTLKQLYERALRYYLMAGDTAACAVVYDNLGYIPLIHHDIPGAMAFSERGLACLRDTTHRSYHRSAAIIESSLCNYFTWSGDVAMGVIHGLRSVRHAGQSGDITIEVHAANQLAGAYLTAHQAHRALPLLLRSDSIARASSMPLNKRRDIPELLSLAYEGMGEPIKALYYYKERSALHDSLRNDATRKEIERLQRRGIQVSDSLRQVAALQGQEQEHQQQLLEEHARRNMLIGAIGVAVLIALLTWSRLRLVRRKNEEILDAQERLLVSEKAREAEEVRTRIARDVHDDISGDLTKIGMLSTDVKGDLSSSEAAASEKIERIKELSRNVGRSLQDIVWSVDPMRDSARELVDRAALHTEQMTHSTGIRNHTSFVHEGPDVRIDPATRRDIYLLLKEALNNSIKYADASQLEVSLHSTTSGFDLRVKDDGRGFDASVARGMGNGLGNMQVRAERLSATWSITSRPGEGTTVLVRGQWPKATLKEGV